LALTFCTLLSSQGADAHLVGPFGRSRGNLSNLAGGTSGVKPGYSHFPSATKAAHDVSRWHRIGGMRPGTGRQMASVPPRDKREAYEPAGGPSNPRKVGGQRTVMLPTSEIRPEGSGVHIARGADHPAAVRPHPLPTLQRLVDRAAGSSAMTVLRNDLVSGQAVPEHSHDVEEVLIVTAGAVEVDIDGAAEVVDAGDAVIVPPHTPHSFRHAHDEPATVFAVLASPDVTINSPS
jgi:quercetin dioxygenase-like cupin family protein